ncbi:hypothetical protein [Actinomadura sp. 21ATH]|uniref:hypothetical protein n=1 Tax=Actinomadura sp. 21ATH TaxID=1735444 RepID=UPI0035C03C32
MTNDLNRALSGALRTAARDAPEPGADLLERVEQGYRRRRRRRRTAAAVLSVAVLLGGTGIAGAGLRPDGPPPVAAEPSGLAPVSAAELGKPVPVRQKWPDAVRTLPARMPDGRAYRPVTLLDPRTLLVTTESRFERADMLWVYDLPNRRAKEVAEVIIPPGSKIFPSDFTVAAGRIVWWLVTAAGGRETLEFWTAPLAGGEPRRLAAMPQAGARMGGMLIDGGQLVWTMAGTGDGAAVYRMPLSGGVPRKIPGTEGLQILSWPWAGAPGERSGARVGDVRFKSIRNLQTGERRTAGVASFKGVWECAVNWCLGGPASDVIYDGSELVTAVQRRNGRDGRSLPADAGMPGGILYERFVPYRTRGAASRNHILYDLETGTLLDTGVRQGNGGISANPRKDARDPLIFLTSGNRKVLIDLSEIR